MIFAMLHDFLENLFFNSFLFWLSFKIMKIILCLAWLCRYSVCIGDIAKSLGLIGLKLWDWKSKLLESGLILIMNNIGLVDRLIDIFKPLKLISHLENISFVILMINHILFTLIFLSAVNQLMMLTRISGSNNTFSQLSLLLAFQFTFFIIWHFPIFVKLVFLILELQSFQLIQLFLHDPLNLSFTCSFQFFLGSMMRVYCSILIICTLVFIYERGFELFMFLELIVCNGWLQFFF